MLKLQGVATLIGTPVVMLLLRPRGEVFNFVVIFKAMVCVGARLNGIVMCSCYFVHPLLDIVIKTHVAGTVYYSCELFFTVFYCIFLSIIEVLLYKLSFCENK